MAGIRLYFYFFIYIEYEMAEEVGFEPTVRFHARRFSRPVHSTTLPLLLSASKRFGHD